MDHLAALSQEVVDLNTSTTELKTVSLTKVKHQGIVDLFTKYTPSLSTFAQHVYEENVIAFKPMSNWFDGWTNKATGDLMNAKLAEIESRLDNVIPSTAVTTGNSLLDPLGGTGNLRLRCSSGTGRGTNNLTNSTVQELTRRVEDIADTIRIMRE